MGKAQELTDEQLLADDGSEGADLDKLDDEVIDGKSVEKQDDLEVVILDDDEGKDKGGKQAKEEAAEDIPIEDDDTGEEVDTDPRAELTEWEKKNYSKAMQNRVLRERRIKDQAVAQAQQQAQAAAVAIRNAKIQTLEAQKVSAALLAEVLTRDITSKQQALLAAKEAGDTEKEVQALTELSDLQARKRDVETTKERLDQAKIEEIKPAEVVKQNPNTEAWLSRNRWFGNKQFADEAVFARTIDAGLAEAYKAGRFAHAPGTGQYFVELDRRIHSKMPTLRAQISKAYGAKPKSTATPVSRGTPQKLGKKVVLEQDDLENMRDFGMDPKNQADLKQYAETKRQREIEERT